VAQTKLKAVNLRMEYYQPRTGGRLLALDNVNLQVDEGEFVTIVGPSGCGKTTFINLADGLLKPTGGQLMIDDQQITGPGTDRGMVFQDSCLMPWRTVFKNVIFGLECQGLDNGEGKERAQKFIKLVGLAGFEDHYPHELSGGMQQRCNLARALTVDPEILIMDEPFAALDAQNPRDYAIGVIAHLERSQENDSFHYPPDQRSYLSGGSSDCFWSTPW
jgi:NitT/TauT family transport system ATP-binding protein